MIGGVLRCVLLGVVLVEGTEAASPEGEMARATELRIDGKFEEALSVLDGVEGHNGGNPNVKAEVMCQRGLILEEAGLYPEALDAYSWVTGELPGSPAAPFARQGSGRTYARMGEYDKAAGQYDALILGYPRYVAAGLLGRGGVEEAMGQLPRAAETYRMLVRNLPGADEVSAARAALERTCATLTADEAGSTSFDEVLARGDCLCDRSRYREAESLYERLLGMKGITTEMEVELLMRIGECLEGGDRVRQAERAYRRVIRLARGTPVAVRAQMGIVQNRLDRDDLREAVQELRKMAKTYSGTEAAAHAHYMIGSCYESLRDAERAREAYRQVLVTAPQTAWAAQAHNSLMRMLEYSP